MFCENLQFNLSLYSDDCLTKEERAAVDAHLAQCPLCRQRLSEFQILRNDLRVLPRPEVSGALLSKMRKTVAAELYTPETAPVFLFSEPKQNWIQMRLMPYSVGVVASLVLGFALVWAMFARIPQNNNFISANPGGDAAILLANAAPKRNFGDPAADEFPVIQISNAAPSVNPSGALVALTKSFVRGSIKDDEVVVVADVFGNGLARIAEVVEPKNDWKTVDELEKALNDDPDFAPFVPAKSRPRRRRANSSFPSTRRCGRRSC